MSGRASPGVVVHRDADELAAAAAARLVTALVDAQSARGSASVVLTGGGVGTATLAAVAASPARGAVDWSRLDVWWGDERFVPDGDPERNATQAYDALLDAVALDPARVHVMAPSDGPDGDDPEAAAARYADELAAAARPEDHGPVPGFDVLMLGVGPEGHVASLFPEMPAVHEQTRTVVGVRGSPKPPPVRLSLTFPAIRAAQEVWFLAAGGEKAGAVRMVLEGAGEIAVPAAGAYGRRRTLWLLDRSAALGASPRPGAHRQPVTGESVEVPDFRGVQSLNAWLAGHDAGLLLCGPDPDGPVPLLDGVVRDQVPAPGTRLRRWDVVTVWVVRPPAGGVREPRRPSPVVPPPAAAQLPSRSTSKRPESEPIVTSTRQRPASGSRIVPG